MSKCAGSLFQVVRIRMSWYGGYLEIAHVLFKTTEPKVENDCSSNFDPHVVRAGAHDVSSSALIANQKKSIAHNCNLLRTYKISVASS